jgi:hypothetical protein
MDALVIFSGIDSHEIVVSLMKTAGTVPSDGFYSYPGNMQVAFGFFPSTLGKSDNVI